jgi:predicted RNase H-like HicB family nuclease
MEEPRTLKVVIEKHADGYVGYPLGLKGVVVGQGDTFDDALSDVRSAIAFHIETFGAAALEDESPVLDAVIVETRTAG